MRRLALSGPQSTQANAPEWAARAAGGEHYGGYLKKVKTRFLGLPQVGVFLLLIRKYI